MPIIQRSAPSQRYRLHRTGQRLFVRIFLTVVMVVTLAGNTPFVGANQQPPPSLPAAQIHPLPPRLAALPTPIAGEDYFDQVQPTEVGALIWSQFPVKVYIDPPPDKASSTWKLAASQALREWQAYLPLEQVAEPSLADIILQSTAPQQRSQGRVRSAQTSYQLFVNAQGLLTHRCTVVVRPNQTPKYVLAALRHELGHALGIWGHSPLPTDALYFAQVAEPPLISRRDINTLLRVYQQPTRLGWPVSSASSPQEQLPAGSDGRQSLP